MKKQAVKKTILVLFVALIFIASYASFGGTGSNGAQKTSTTTIPSLYPASGNANVIITGYAPSISITVLCKNASIASNAINRLNNMLANLSSKGSINGYYQLNSTFKVESGTFNALAVYSYISKNISFANNCTTFSAYANIALPQMLALYYTSSNGRQLVTLLVPAMYRNYSVPINMTENISNKINVRIFALFAANATSAIIYNMSIGAS